MSSGNDTIRAAEAPGSTVTGTGPPVLTVSSRTKPDASRPPGTGKLTLNDANSPLHAPKKVAEHRARLDVITRGVAALRRKPKELPVEPTLLMSRTVAKERW
jgi:hypothetical protein